MHRDVVCAALMCLKKLGIDLLFLHAMVASCSKSII